MECSHSTETLHAGQEPFVLCSGRHQVAAELDRQPRAALRNAWRSERKVQQCGRIDLTIPNPVPSSPAYPTNPSGSIWFAGLNWARSKSLRDQDHRDASPRFRVHTYPELGLPRRRGAIRYPVERGYRGRSDGLWLRLRLSQLVRRCGQFVHSSTTTPVVQLSGSGANLPVVTGAAARNPLSYITPANPQGSGGTIPYTPYHLPIQNGWQWTAGVQRRLPGNMVAEDQYVGSHWSA